MDDRQAVLLALDVLDVNCPVAVDVVTAECGWLVERTCAQLAAMDRDGLVERVPDGQWRACVAPALDPGAAADIADRRETDVFVPLDDV